MKSNIFIALAATALASFSMAYAKTTVVKTANVKAAKANLQPTHAVWRPETLSGKITMVDPARKLVVLQGSDGVPFDMVVNRSTRIKSATGTLNWNDLNSDLNRNASIRFVPEGRGDIAQTITVTQ